jgi:hypothetical protein
MHANASRPCAHAIKFQWLVQTYADAVFCVLTNAPSSSVMMRIIVNEFLSQISGFSNRFSMKCSVEWIVLDLNAFNLYINCDLIT